METGRTARSGPQPAGGALMDDKDLKELMYTRAFIQAQAAKELLGAPLWMKPESLPALDQLIDKNLQRELRDTQTVAEVVGAFLGECLRAPTGAVWTEVDGAPLLALPDGRKLDPVDRARARLTTGKGASLAAYGEAALRYAADPSAPSPDEARSPKGIFRWGKRS